MNKNSDLLDYDSINRYRKAAVSATTVSPPVEGAETVDHPPHYGGEVNTYEAIKVIEAWQLNFNLGNCVKYVARAGKKGDRLEDLRKAAWYLQREIGRGLP